MPGKGVTPTALRRTTKIDFADAEVVRDTCTSKDGTKVPMTIVRKKGAKLDGNAPALLTGYGGYGIARAAVVPRREPPLARSRRSVRRRQPARRRRVWRGLARRRQLTNKQNVFDDLYACARSARGERITRPERLAIEGGSNGGLLMGAELTQHPDAFRAVVSHVGIYDMLRVELDAERRRST